MQPELDKAYNPKTVEKTIYQKWEKSGFFNPDNLPGKRKKIFSISMPPPNVTGELHLGHATTLTIEDILTRYRRMAGDKTLFLPGTDHAGISTQIMVERMIAKAGLDRHKIGREQFLKKTWEWKKKFGSRITEQIRQLGASCDWSREHFTMDANLTKAVQRAFIKMYNDRLIYRGDRIVNWCPRCSSAISDLEVKHVPTNSKLWYIKYPLFGTTKYLVVATTRPETMLGDTAVAVNPKDKRYVDFIGKTIILPLVEREIPIIADTRVDMEFGTGAVKVTPAHDPLDYEIGLEHKLEAINVIGQDNKMTKLAGEYYGKSVQDARLNIVRNLEEENLLEKTTDYSHNQARCDRCNAPIEPLISKQWFIKIKPLAKSAIEAVKKGKIKIVPKRFEKIYFHWMENIKDWCISRQLWWGHPIPIWYCDQCQEPVASIEKPGVCKKCKTKEFTQDEDILDTWFSSGLWTFSTLGWPNKTKDLKTYHPTTVMETGWDILFFWIARMIMMSLYLLKEVPFKTVYLNGLVLDKDGKKMSKSKGTGVDPIPMTEKYGTDAIRLSLILGTSAGQDFRLYEEKIAGYRNFVNKLWNVARFIIMNNDKKLKKLEVKTLADQWIVSSMQKLIEDTTDHLDAYHFSEAGLGIYEFLWHEFADWYIEVAKTEKNSSVQYYVLENTLRLSHPFIPFVTEKIWQQMNGTAKKDSLIIQEWPISDKKLINKDSEKQFTLIRQFISGLRNFRAEQGIAKDAKISVWYWGKNSNLIDQNSEFVNTSVRAEKLINEEGKKTTGSLPGLDYFLDFQINKSKRKNEIEKISQYIQKLERKLSDRKFIKNAPKGIIAQEKQKLEEQQQRLKKLL